MIINNINLKTTTENLNCHQLSNIGEQIFKSDDSKLLQLTENMIKNNIVKTTLEFAKRFMFTFDSKYQFPISIDSLIEMKVYDNKGNTKTKLIKNFILDIDYEVKILTSESSEVKILKKHGGIRHKENIMLTVDCFKSMCMLANSEIGKQVKIYYLDLEKIFKQYIILELQEKQSQLKQYENDYDKLRKLHNSLKFKRNYHELEQGDCVYICHNKLEPPDRYKIGKTDNINKTLKVYRRNAPYTLLDYLFFTSKASLLENILLSRYIDERRPMNHEVVENIKLENIIEDIKKIVEFIKIPGSENKEDNIKKYNNDINTPDIIVIEDDEDYIEEKVDILTERVEIIEEKVDILTGRVEVIEEKQKTDYEELLKNIEKYTDKKLKELLIEFKLPVSGLKDVKKQRLRCYISGSGSIVNEKACVQMTKQVEDLVIKSEDRDDYEDVVELDKLSVTELRRVCSKYGLKQEGLKSELIKRVNSYLDNGDKEKHGLAKTVYKYDMNGNFICWYESVKEAAKSIGGETNEKIKQDRISDICLNKNGKSYIGFVWKYQNNEMTKEEVSDVNKHSRARVIIKENMKGEEIQKFKSLVEAARVLDVNLNTLTDALRKRGKYIRGDFILKYEGSVVKRLTEDQKRVIIKKYKEGVSVVELSKEYSKSVKQLRRVLSDK
jgi:hypothetical protein